MMNTDQIQPVPVINPQEQLTALRDWANKAFHYIQRRNHLNPDEKRLALDRLEKHCHQLNKSFQVLESIPASSPHLMTAFLEEMDVFVRRQVYMNQIARLYEIPVFTDFPAGFVEWHEPLVVSFDVIGDELADSLWKDDHLITTLLPQGQWPSPQGLVVIQYSTDRRAPRGSKIGWFKQADEGLFTLEYQHALLTETKPDWSIPIHQLVHIYKVNSIHRDIK